MAGAIWRGSISVEELFVRRPEETSRVGLARVSEMLNASHANSFCRLYALVTCGFTTAYHIDKISPKIQSMYSVFGPIAIHFQPT